VKDLFYVVGGLGFLVLLLQPFATRLTVYLVTLPFLTWLQIHVPFKGWSLVSSAVLVATALAAVGTRTARRRGDTYRPAYGLTAVVLLYVALVVVEVANPGLPSVTLGLRGARLVLEPLLMFFIGAEVATRPALIKRVVSIVLVTGAIVAAYGLKQGLFGFDARETAFYRHNFAVSLREQRIFSTMAGATVFGNYMALVAFLAIARFASGSRRWVALSALGLTAAFDMLLTGQRGVIIAALPSAGLVIFLGLLRRSTRWRMARVAQVTTLVVAALVALLLITPVQNRRVIRQHHTTPLAAATVKLAELKAPNQDTSVGLRVHRLAQMRQALETVPLGAGDGLNLLISPQRSAQSSVLGVTGFGGSDYQPPVAPIPGELYYYTLSSELGLVGLALFLGLALFGLVTAAGIAVRHPDPRKAAIGLATAGFIVFVLVDSFTVDAMTTTQVASYFWLLIGLVGRWAQQDRAPSPDPIAPARKRLSSPVAA
jgi:hypothetical protein